MDVIRHARTSICVPLFRFLLRFFVFFSLYFLFCFLCLTQGSCTPLSETSLTIESLDSDSFRPLRPVRHILSAPYVTPRVFSTLPQEQISMEWLYAKFGEWVKHLPGEEQRRLFGGTAEDFYRI